MTTRIIKYSWQDVEKAVQDIAMQMYKSNWRPDYIVGITRGGLVPSVMLSHMTGVPLHTLCVQLEMMIWKKMLKQTVGWQRMHMVMFKKWIGMVFTKK